MINKERIVQTFLDYVRIDSETHHEKAMTERLTADLRALGLEVYTDRAGEKAGVDSDGANVYCFLEGEPGFDPILFSAHMDTVSPGKDVDPYLEDGYIRTRGETVLGADDKSGIAAIMEALRTLACFPGKKLIVTPGMVELGAEQEALNRRFGEQIAAYADLAILVGSPARVAPLIAGATSGGMKEGERVFAVRTLNDATAKMQTLITAGDTVLFENDLPDNYD